MKLCLIKNFVFSSFLLKLKPGPSFGKHSDPNSVLTPEVEFIKLNSAKIYRFLQLLSHSRGFFVRV
jgi:hypothetical protein